jgi:hypothetical protein
MILLQIKKNPQPDADQKTTRKKANHDGIIIIIIVLDDVERRPDGGRLEDHGAGEPAGRVRPMVVRAVGAPRTRAARPDEASPPVARP